MEEAQPPWDTEGRLTLFYAERFFPLCASVRSWVACATNVSWETDSLVELLVDCGISVFLFYRCSRRLVRVPWARCRLLLGRFLRTRQTLAQRSLRQEKCNEPARPSRRETALWNTTFPYFCFGCRRTPKPAARRHLHATLRTTVRMLSATHFWTVIPRVSV